MIFSVYREACTIHNGTCRTYVWLGIHDIHNFLFEKRCNSCDFFEKWLTEFMHLKQRRKDYISSALLIITILQSILVNWSYPCLNLQDIALFYGDFCSTFFQNAYCIWGLKTLFFISLGLTRVIYKMQYNIFTKRRAETIFNRAILHCLQTSKLSKF